MICSVLVAVWLSDQAPCLDALRCEPFRLGPSTRFQKYHSIGDCGEEYIIKLGELHENKIVIALFCWRCSYGLQSKFNSVDE